MKTIGVLLGSLVAATASASVCDSPDCPCRSVGDHVASAWPLLAGVVVLGAAGFAVKKPGARVLMLFTLLLSLVGTTLAADTKAQAPAKVTIADVLAKPSAYAGKEVTVKARLAGVCADDGCLTLKDKLDVIEGQPPTGGFKKEPKVGSTLSVTGTVKVKGEGKDQTVAIAVKDFEVVKK